MGRKNTGMGFGKGLEKRRNDEKKQQVSKPLIEAEPYGNSASRSVMELSNIDELIATVEMKTGEWEDAFGSVELIEEEEEENGGPVLLDLKLAEAEKAAADSRQFVSIPRRPKWTEGMTNEELQNLESVAFMEWRRGLRELQEDGGLVMTPYERNLDFWRQLWRCMERSDLLVQVLDARDPDFYFCQDLYRYVQELGGNKRLMLLVNKADYLTREQRQEWADYFEAKGVDAVFFSALSELAKQGLAPLGKSSCNVDTWKQTRDNAKHAVEQEPPAEPEEDSSNPVDIPVPDSSDDELDGAAAPEADDSSEDDREEAKTRFLDSEVDHGVIDVAQLLEALRARLDKCKAGASEEDKGREGVVGFVGYPNVGKSTIVNALMGEKKVGMSRRAGKTRHIQTLQLPSWGFTLCDAPGLVFPSVVATRAHLVINNTIPLEQLTDRFSPSRIIIEKIGFADILKRYKCAAFVKDAATRSGDHVLDETHSFLAAFAVSRNHLLWVGVPDENWAARRLLSDYVSGRLLHCEPPPSSARAAQTGKEALELEKEDLNEIIRKTGVQQSNSHKLRGEIAAEDVDDFEDLDGLMLDDTVSTVSMKPMTKKKERHLQKQWGKGVAPEKLDKKRTGANARAFGVSCS